MKKARIREPLSTVLIFLAVILLGCGLRVAWIVGAVGGGIRLTVMLQDKRWWYVALDVAFMALDVEMYGAWSGWWPNHIKEFVLGIFPWLF